MTIDEILIESGPGEMRVALLEQGRLCELHIDRVDLRSIVGDVFVGRVERVLPNIAAAFVNIGQEKPGFLGLAEVRPPGVRSENTVERISDYVTEGEAVVVQVQRDPAHDKGAKLTTHIGLTGRRLVLLPGVDEIKLSRRIDGDEERARLSTIVEGLRGETEGFILRTASAGASVDAIGDEIALLRGALAEMQNRQKNAKPPVRIYAEPDVAHRILRDDAGPEVKGITVDDAGTLAALRDFCRIGAPDVTDLLRGHDEDTPLFQARGIEEQIDEALAPTVPLPSGGSLIIEETRALVAIDVNTGVGQSGGPEETAFRTNMEAADEIARQMRLRNLAGLLVVDFAKMKRRTHLGDVLGRMRLAVSSDPNAAHVLGFTKLGLMEMTRRRQSRSLREIMTAGCAACQGNGAVRDPLSVGFGALRRALREGRATPGASVQIVAAPSVVDALTAGGGQAIRETREKLGGRLDLIAEPEFGPEQIDVSARRDGRVHNG
ncbi:MAG: Rne/Rng family ribonuclease [Alphaproteobacteria bacterium]|nr:Rne/Rng family ribonuclease [Alphaproteobacteria bacterium]